MDFELSDDQQALRDAAAALLDGRSGPTQVRAIVDAGGGYDAELWKAMVDAVHHAWRYATWHRRLRKRDFRSLWITRINAAVRPHGISYSKFMGALKRGKVNLDRKILADLALTDPTAFGKIVDQAKAAKA